MNVTLIDYGAGNLPSVERALQRLGVPTRRTAESAAMAEASALILPGVGHYSALVRALDTNGLREALLEAMASGVPFLGICLGLQVLYRASEEAPELRGLDVLHGSVRRLTGAVKLPHMGWNQVRGRSRSQLLEGVPPAASFYFAHSSAASHESDSPVEVRATCSYGIDFTAVAEKENIFAVQFHPEKSGEVGQRVLQNFLRIAA